jgi:oligopeptide transport system substrate-binding protein
MNCTLRIPISFTLLILLCFSCKEKNIQTNSNNINTGGELKTVLVDPVETLDPIKIIYSSDWKTSFLIFEGLVTAGKNIQTVKPLLAESWEILEGGTRIIFKLKEGVKFHDDPCFKNGIGRTLAADDIIYTFERIADKKSSSINWSLFQNKIIGINEFRENKSSIILGIKKLDDNSIEFNLTKPFVSFLKVLASPTAYVIPKEAVEYYGEQFGNHPVGTGPYRLAEWDPLEGLTLVKNENYWERDKNNFSLPYIDKISIKILHNAALVLPELLKSECNVTEVSNETFLNLIKDSSISANYKFVNCNNGFNIRFIGFAVDKSSSIVSNLNFRKAISFGLNKVNLIEENNPNLIIASSLVPPIFYDYKDEGYSFSKKKSADLLNDINFSRYNNSVQILSSIKLKSVEQICELISRVKLKSIVEVSDHQYYRKIINGGPDIFKVSMSPSYADPEEYFSLFYSKSNAAINLTGYSNKKFDEIFEKMLIEQNLDVRLTLFKKLEQILRNDAPFIPISHEKPNYLVMPKYIKNLKSKFGIPEYKYAWIDE